MNTQIHAFAKQGFYAIGRDLKTFCGLFVEEAVKDTCLSALSANDALFTVRVAISL